MFLKIHFGAYNLVIKEVSLKLSNSIIEYLGEIETKFENVLTCLSGARKVQIKTEKDDENSRRSFYFILHK